MFLHKVYFVIIIILLTKSITIAQQFNIEQNKFVKLDLSEYHNSNFVFFDSLLTKSEVVLLGEGLHRYSQDSKTKLQIIKYLHEELGYNSLFLEFNIYDFWDLNNHLGSKYGFKDTLNKYCNFNFSEGIIDIIKYVNDCKLKGDTFNIGGVDIWITHLNDYRHFLLFINENKKHLNSRYAAMFSFENNTRPSISFIETLKDSVINDLFDSDQINELWVQIYMNYKLAYKYYEEIQNYYKKYPYVKNIDSLFVLDDFKQRDSMMFANYLFLSKKFNTKSIILASNFHVRKEVEPFLSNPRVGNNTIPFGSYFSDYHINSFHIASISYKVEEYTKQNIYRKYFHRDKKSLEKFLHKKYQQDGFIELKNIELIGDSTFIMYPVWRFETKGDWQKAFDAVIYLNEINLPKNIKTYP